MAETKPEFVQAPIHIVDNPSNKEQPPVSVSSPVDTVPSKILDLNDQARLDELGKEIERLSNQGQPTIHLQREIARIRGEEVPSVRRKDGPYLEDIMPREQIEENLRNGLPASYSPLHIRTGQEARGDRSPTWRGPRRRSTTERTK